MSLYRCPENGRPQGTSQAHVMPNDEQDSDAGETSPTDASFHPDKLEVEAQGDPTKTSVNP